MNQTDLNEIIIQMGRASRVLFITGAGISAESGLPTYRGIEGLYTDGFVDEDLPIEEALSGTMLIKEPAITWKYIHQIELACRDKTYNQAHAVIAELQDRFEAVWVLTQNVDGYHQAAGSKNVIEIHGNLHDLHCTCCNYEERVTDYSALQIPPQCPVCKSLVRPRVVMFGELLPEAEIAVLSQQLKQGFDLIFSIGTTSVFPYIAGPVELAADYGIPTVEINPDDTEVSHLVSYKLDCGAVEAMQMINAQLNHGLA